MRFRFFFGPSISCRGAFLRVFQLGGANVDRLSSGSALRTELRILPFRDARPAGAADDDVRSNANMPVARTPVLAARPHGRSIFELLMVEKRIVIHEPNPSVRLTLLHAKAVAVCG